MSPSFPMTGHARTPRRRPAVLLLAVLAVLPSLASADFAVYADSWITPTQAQEQATRINRALEISTAGYERATVQGRVFWRVRVGAYATREEANRVRTRLTNAGFAGSWIRELSEGESGTVVTAPGLPPPVVAPRRPATTATSATTNAPATTVAAIATPSPATTDSLARIARRDSLARAARIDSLAALARRNLDSLESASRRRIDELVRKMSGDVAAGLLVEIERDQMRQQATYVTQDEHQQMTRALIDEMNTRMAALRDSIHNAEVEREARRPRLSCSVAARSFGQWSDAADTLDGPASASGGTEFSDAWIGGSWRNEGSEVAVALRATPWRSVELREAWATWAFSRTNGTRRVLGGGIVEQPFGLEPVRVGDLLAPSPGQLAGLRGEPFAAMWIVPYASAGAEIMIMPYGKWTDERQLAFLRLRLSSPANRFVLALGGERNPSAVCDDDEYRALGDLVFEHRGPIWTLGFEALGRLRRDTVVRAPDEGRRDERTIGGMLLLHRRFATWGWTFRGDLVLRMNRAIGGAEYLVLEDDTWSGTVTTGPLWYLGERLRFSLMYTANLERYYNHRHYSMQSHRVEVGLSHGF